MGLFWNVIPSTRTSKVTLELRELIESGVNIWDFDYPSYYTGEQKKAFEQKVIDHFYFRQIGQETPGRWLHYFRSRMREIMPYYIQRYESEALLKNAGDPLESYNLTETMKQKTTDKGSSESSSEGTNSTEGVSKFSDTPTGSIDNLDKYLTSGTQSDASGSSSGSASASHENENALEYELTRRGNIGVQPLGQEINVYRSALINVDMEIINELNDLFLMVY